MANVFIHVKSLHVQKVIAKIFNATLPDACERNVDSCDILITDNFELWTTWMNHQAHTNEVHRTEWQAKTLMYISTAPNGLITLNVIPSNEIE